VHQVQEAHVDQRPGLDPTTVNDDFGSMTHITPVPTRKETLGTDNPQRARGWILAINAMLSVLTVELPRMTLTTPGLPHDLRLHAEDFFFSCRLVKSIGDSRRDLHQIRSILVDEFDLPAA